MVQNEKTAKERQLEKEAAYDEAVLQAKIDRAIARYEYLASKPAKGHIC